VPKYLAVVPDTTDLAELAGAAARCTACPLWRGTTQTVFGEGPPDARMVLVGEQPGDQEDLEGEPFVGPAGRVLDAGLEAAGIDRGSIYLTNVVKHFNSASWWPPCTRRRS
jgi:DNA polymerase